MWKRPRSLAGRIAFWVGATGAPWLTPAGADLHAQAAATAGRHVAVASPQFIALMVADLEASTRWYHEMLGVTIEADFELPGATGRGRILRTENLVVEMIADRRASAIPDPAPAGGPAHPVHGVFKIGIQVASLADALAVLRERGATIVGAWPGSRPPNALIRDNSGNLLQFFEGRP